MFYNFKDIFVGNDDIFKVIGFFSFNSLYFILHFKR